MKNNRRLSIPRLIFATGILGILTGAAFFYFYKTKNLTPVVARDPWFAPYVDVTSTPRFAFEQISTQNQKNLVLSFIVSKSSDACTPTWGNAYTLTEAETNLDLDRRIARFRQLGGNIAISFGGQLNDELSVKCTDSGKLLDAYKAVIDHYTVDTIDLDIEGSNLSDLSSTTRRAQVIAKLQQLQRSQNKNLAVWITLPVTPQGLTESGTNAVSQMLKNGVDVSGVNIMTMDYGQSKDSNQSMEKASELALNETHRQLGILYSQAGIYLSDASIWKKMGATPMIGVNDLENEVFSLEDAKNFNQFTLSKNIARVSMWSINRDIECGENYVNISIVSDSCSGTKQDKFAFTNLLGEGFTGYISANSDKVTQEDAKTAQAPDDPKFSPYQIWSDTGTYLEGTKVVWHHNVYEAKWWTQGDLPDNPVLQSYQTPWQLIGPVLPGETPVPQPRLPEGTYPVWEGATIYDAGQRVLFNGVPYQAKWWTQGDSPAASSSNPDGSPWKVLSVEQIKQVLGEK